MIFTKSKHESIHRCCDALTCFNMPIRRQASTHHAHRLSPQIQFSTLLFGRHEHTTLAEGVGVGVFPARERYAALFLCVVHVVI